MSESALQLGITQQQEMQAILQEGWRLTPATMAYRLTNGRWIPAKHLMHISTIIATALAKGNAHIIVTMGPRHGKSEFLSVHTPIWYLDRNPDEYVMTLSYGLELATDFSLKVRTAFLDEENHHLLSTRLRRDKLKIDRFLTTGDGGQTAAGIGGPITGRGANLLLIDDYVKNAEAALSATQKTATWEWVKSTALTRLEPNGSIIILATRWAQDDLIGMVLEEWDHMNWVVINLPALALPNDPLGRRVGEPLWPERYSLEALLSIKKALGTYWWEAMYQQDPRASMSELDLGEMVKVIEPADVPHPSKLLKMRIWDLASTEGGGDYTAGPLMARCINTNKIYILGMKRKQYSAGKVETLVSTTADSDGGGVAIWMEQEPGSAGKNVVEHYRDDVLSGFSFKFEKATGQVEIRAQPLSAAIEDGRVHMVRAPWNKALKKELNAFPDGDHDDQVVALALGYRKIARKGKGATWGRKKKGGDNPPPIHAHKILQHSNRRISRLTW